MYSCGRIALALSILSLVVGLAVAQEHSPNDPGHWYPQHCCSGRDCEPIPIDGLFEEADGWKVRYLSVRHGEIDEFVQRKKAHKSQDGRFHGCWRKGLEKPRMICFFEPVNS